jgi:hypothetical protein
MIRLTKKCKIRIEYILYIDNINESENNPLDTFRNQINNVFTVSDASMRTIKTNFFNMLSYWQKRINY